MPVELEEGTRLKRQIKIQDLDVPLIASITRDGIEFKTKGAKLGVSQTWSEIVAASRTPDHIPQFLAGKPVNFLRHSASNILRSKMKRAQSKNP
jgi:hypothetical protein